MVNREASGVELSVLSPPESEKAKQDIPVFFGVSEATADARGLSMNVTSFPPGGSSNAHMHLRFETAIYVQTGRIALFFGSNLEEMKIASAGDFVFIPPELVHKAYNLSLTEPAVAISARNDPREQENVVLKPEADDGTPDERVKQQIA